MKNTSKHKRALDFFTVDGLPSAEQIESMDVAELAKHLSEHGENIASVSAFVSDLKKEAQGRLNLASARAARLSSKRDDKPVNLIEFTIERMKSELAKKYNGIENLPIAARNFKKEPTREEWESLYRDLILGDQKKNLQ